MPTVTSSPPPEASASFPEGTVSENSATWSQPSRSSGGRPPQPSTRSGTKKFALRGIRTSTSASLQCRAASST